jgi:hypothetical protein
MVSASLPVAPSSFLVRKLHFVGPIHRPTDDDLRLLGIGEAVAADLVHLHLHLAAGTEHIDLGDVFCRPRLDRRGRHHTGRPRLGSFLEVFQIPRRKLLAHIRQRRKVHEIRAVVEPAGAAADEGKHQQVVARSAADTEVDLAEIRGLGGGPVLAGLQKLEPVERWRRRGQIEHRRRKRPFFGNNPVFRTSMRRCSAVTRCQWRHRGG